LWHFDNNPLLRRILPRFGLTGNRMSDLRRLVPNQLTDILITLENALDQAAVPYSIHRTDARLTAGRDLLLIKLQADLVIAHPVRIHAEDAPDRLRLRLDDYPFRSKDVGPARDFELGGIRNLNAAVPKATTTARVALPYASFLTPTNTM